MNGLSKTEKQSFMHKKWENKCTCIDKTCQPCIHFNNLAHSDVTVFHSFKPKVEKIFMNSNE